MTLCISGLPSLLSSTSSGILYGLLRATAAVNSLKHCSHGTRSGTSFLICIRSAACTTMTCPSKARDTALPLPFAGGKSLKSIYSPTSSLSINFFSEVLGDSLNDGGYCLLIELQRATGCWGRAVLLHCAARESLA